MKSGILIATRSYPLDGFMAADLLYRRSNGGFILKETSDDPQDKSREVKFSLPQVYQWLSEMPEQIDRAVILGG